MVEKSFLGIPLLHGFTVFELVEHNNTYGFYTINLGTFNQAGRNCYTYPKPLRDIIVTVLAIHNVALNILSYSCLYIVSGIARILTGTALCVFTLTQGKRQGKEGFPIQQWYDEALVTGSAQVLRGVIDVFVPFGCLVNTAIDGVSFGMAMARFMKNPYEYDIGGYRNGKRVVHDDPPATHLLMSINAIALPALFLWVGSRV